jgi:hypothetical protein
MSIVFTCENCGKEFTVGDELGGKKGRCKGCGEIMRIPEVSASGPAEPPRPPAREVARTRRTKTKSPTQTRPATRSDLDAQVGDVYGFEDANPAQSALAETEVDASEESPALPRSAWSPPAASGSKKKRKKKRSGPSMIDDETIIAKTIIGIAIASIFVMGAIPLVRAYNVVTAPKVFDRAKYEGLLRETIDQERRLSTFLAIFTGPNPSGTTPTRVRELSMSLAKRFEMIRDVKGELADIEAGNQKFRNQLGRATARLDFEINRLKALPGAWQWLNVDESMVDLMVVPRDLVANTPPGSGESNKTAVADADPNPDPEPAEPPAGRPKEPGSTEFDAQARAEAKAESESRAEAAATRAKLERLVSEKSQITSSLWPTLGFVNPGSVARMAPELKVKMKQLIANLRRFKDAKGSRDDFDWVAKTQFISLRLGTEHLASGLARIRAEPALWQALGLEGLLQELIAVENDLKANPGLWTDPIPSVGDLLPDAPAASSSPNDPGFQFPDGSPFPNNRRPTKPRYSPR